MACKEGQFDVAELMVNDQFKTFSINLNTQHVTGMTPFDLAVHMYGYKTLQSRLKIYKCCLPLAVSLQKEQKKLIDVESKNLMVMMTNNCTTENHPIVEFDHIYVKREVL